MKVKSWTRRHFITEHVEDEKVRKLLFDNGISIKRNFYWRI